MLAILISLGFVASLIVIGCLICHYSENKCCRDTKNWKIRLRVPAETALWSIPVVFQIEKCSVCGTEKAYRISESRKTHIEVDFLKGLIGEKLEK